MMCSNTGCAPSDMQYMQLLPSPPPFSSAYPSVLVVGTHTYAHKTTNTHGPHSNAQVGELQHHMDQRISNIEKIFVTTVAPLVETLDILVRQQTENAALMAVRNANKP